MSDLIVVGAGGTMEGPSGNLGTVTDAGVTISASKSFMGLRRFDELRDYDKQLVGVEITASFSLRQWSQAAFRTALGYGEYSGGYWVPDEQTGQETDNNTGGFSVFWEDPPGSTWQVNLDSCLFSQETVINLSRDKNAELPCQLKVINGWDGMWFYGDNLT